MKSIKSGQFPEESLIPLAQIILHMQKCSRVAGAALRGEFGVNDI